MAASDNYENMTVIIFNSAQCELRCIKAQAWFLGVTHSSTRCHCELCRNGTLLGWRGLGLSLIAPAPLVCAPPVLESES